MAFFDDMTNALQTYPVTNVTLEIFEVVTPGSALNESEEGSFKVRVTNNGPLELIGVTLKVSGQNGTTVRNNGAAAVFAPEFVTATSQLPTIGGHGNAQSTIGSPLKFKAPLDDTNRISKTLVTVTLEAWDATLNHILIGHSDPLPNGPKGTYAAVVEPL